MNKEILDEIEKEILPPKFALKSFDQFWYSIICYTIVPIIFELLKRANILNESLISSWGILFFYCSFFLGTVGFVINFFGMFNAIKSRRRQEVFTWKILLGSFGNMLLVLMSIWFIFELLDIPRRGFGG